MKQKIIWHITCRVDSMDKALKAHTQYENTYKAYQADFCDYSDPMDEEYGTRMAYLQWPHPKHPDFIGQEFFRIVRTALQGRMDYEESFGVQALLEDDDGNTVAIFEHWFSDRRSRDSDAGTFIIEKSNLDSEYARRLQKIVKIATVGDAQW